MNHALYADLTFVGSENIFLRPQRCSQSQSLTYKAISNTYLFVSSMEAFEGVKPESFVFREVLLQQCEIRNGNSKATTKAIIFLPLRLHLLLCYFTISLSNKSFSPASCNNTAFLIYNPITIAKVYCMQQMVLNNALYFLLRISYHNRL